LAGRIFLIQKDQGLHEIIFRLSFVALFVSAVLITVNHQRKAGNYGRGMTSHAGSHMRHEAKELLAIRGALALLWYPTVLGWLFAPRWIRWSVVELPDAGRWAGGVLGLAGLFLLWQSQRAMGKNFAPTLEMKEDHQLVTEGPYRWVRHPMYIAFLLMISGAGVLAQNWFMELTGTLLIGSVMMLRIPREEALLADRFGEEYAEYRKKTPCLIPFS
jgi:protein-S-isoprenylcysteine O-methyltransferase Ste14